MNSIIRKPSVDVRSKVRRYRPILVLFFVLAALSFAPGLWSLGWYAFHDHRLAIGGQSVMVPFGWIVDAPRSRPDELMLRKLPVNVFGRQCYNWITFSALSSSWGSTQTAAYANWKASLQRLYPPDRFLGVREHSIGLSACVTVQPRGDRNVQTVDCLLVRDRTRGQFTGCTGDDQFLRLVKNLR